MFIIIVALKGDIMFVTDILAFTSSLVALIYTFIYFDYISKLASSITSKEKQIIFICMVIIICVTVIKLAAVIVKFALRELRFGKKPESLEGGGFLAKAYVFTESKAYRILSVCVNGLITFYVLSMFVLVSPFQKYTVGRATYNEDLARLWEINWFLPMLGFFFVIFAVHLIISAVRLGIFNVKKEYDEVYAIAKSRALITIRCRACGFDNHVSSVCCGNCDADLHVPKGIGVNRPADKPSDRMTQHYTFPEG